MYAFEIYMTTYWILVKRIGKSFLPLDSVVFLFYYMRWSKLR